MKRRTLAFAAVGALLSLSACSGSKAGPDAVAGQTPSGIIELSAVQAAYIGSASSGSGTLTSQGRSYPFSIDGAGIGDIGASTIKGDGEVYNLPDAKCSPAPPYRDATGSRWATAAAAICGFRTTPV
jgi:hypothetical protein